MCKSLLLNITNYVGYLQMFKFPPTIQKKCSQVKWIVTELYYRHLVTRMYKPVHCSNKPKPQALKYMLNQ